MSTAVLRAPAAAAFGDDRLGRLARTYAGCLEVLAGAIGRHDGCNLSGADILASRSGPCRRYVRQAADVLDDLLAASADLAGAARRAVLDDVLFDGPHERPGALDDHEPTRRLLDLVLACGQSLAEALA